MVAHSQGRAVGVSVREVLDRVSSGELRIPDFQRPLKWSTEDDLKLLDSIYRGWPIGALLFWERPSDSGVFDLGEGFISVPGKPGAWWLVDGQQRTVAMARRLLELQGLDREVRTVFDPESRVFLECPLNGHCKYGLPTHVLGCIRRLCRWFREHPETPDELMSVIEEAQSRILSFSVPGYVMEGVDEEVVRHAFARINSTGKAMTKDEVFRALDGS